MMFTSPEGMYSYAKQRQQELIAEADRQRVLSAARRARRSEDAAARHAERAGPENKRRRGAAIAAGA